MQAPSWYYNRLRSMSAAEILWRARGAARDAADRYRIALGWYPTAAAYPGGRPWGAFQPGFRVCDIEPGSWAAPDAGIDEQRWLARLRRQADRLVAHRFDFFDLEDKFLGDPIDWHRDHGCGRPTPRTYAQAIDYRDFAETGDCKLVWEPSRHHHLVVLGRACRASGDVRYAQELAAQLDSWLEDNPFGIGMQWRSPLELGVRLINWVWALDLVRETDVISEDLGRRLQHAAYLHCWEISRKYSRGSSANNHLIGEAAGVLVAAGYFADMPGAARLREESRAILMEELQRQSYPDGCTREQALGYQLFVLQFFLVVGVACRARGEDLPGSYWDRVEKGLEFLAHIQEGGRLPKFGDADDGYVLDLGGDRGEARQLLALGAALFRRKDFARIAATDKEPVRWLLGPAGMKELADLDGGDGTNRLASRSFGDSGYYALQCGVAGTPRAVSVLFDCGELGYGAIAAHGHADALSFTVRVGGEDLLVDPGTYDYFTYAEWRRYFRSTKAHNTVTVDGEDQSAMLGPFLWGVRATAACTRWAPRAGGGGLVSGEHDGYTRLANAVRHRRTLELDERGSELRILDEILTGGAHDVEIAFHVSESCRVEEVAGQPLVLTQENGNRIALELDPALSRETWRATENPMGGWVSRGYHRKAPSTTIVGRARVAGDRAFSCSLKLLDANPSGGIA